MNRQLKTVMQFLILAGFSVLLSGFFPFQKEVAEKDYPKPRFPSYLRLPKSAEEVMKNVRMLVRNKSGFEGLGMGVAQRGEAILLVPTADAEDMIVEGIRMALEERGVKAVSYTHLKLPTNREV